LHQLARGVIDEDQQGAGFATLKPSPSLEPDISNERLHLHVTEYLLSDMIDIGFTFASFSKHLSCLGLTSIARPLKFQMMWAYRVAS
jgi:hypothetical protein